VIFVFILFIALYFYNLNESHSKTIAKKNIEYQELKQQAQDLIDIAESEAAHKTKIETIQSEIKISKSIWNDYNEKLEQAQKLRDANIWYQRCLEALWELELQSEKYDLECLPYQYDILFSEFNEDTYEELKKFDTFNFMKTRESLDL